MKGWEKQHNLLVVVDICPGCSSPSHVLDVFPLLPLLVMVFIAGW